MSHTNHPPGTSPWAKNRKAAGDLLEAVFDERVTPRYALNHWPVLADGWQDPSLDAAFQALWHFEADEEKQQTEVYYMDAQLELIKQMAAYLQQGKDLPHYLLKAYDKALASEYYREKKLVDESVLQVQVGWHKFRALFLTTLSFLPLHRLQRPRSTPKTTTTLASQNTPYGSSKGIWGNPNPRASQITPFNKHCNDQTSSHPYNSSHFT